MGHWHLLIGSSGGIAHTVMPNARHSYEDGAGHVWWRPAEWCSHTGRAAPLRTEVAMAG